MTMLYVLSHTEPSELEQHNGRYEVSQLLSALEPATAHVLGRLIEPDLLRRYGSAAGALRDLRGLEPLKAPTTEVARPAFWNRSLVRGVSLFRIAVGVILGIALGYLLLVRWSLARQDELYRQRGLSDESARRH